MISLRQAIKQHIPTVRKPIWAEPLDHLRIGYTDRADVRPIWMHLHCPANQSVNGRDPVSLLILNFDLDAEEWEPYEGPSHESPEYQASVDGYNARAAAGDK